MVTVYGYAIGLPVWLGFAWLVRFGWRRLAGRRALRLLMVLGTLAVVIPLVGSLGVLAAGLAGKLQTGYGVSMGISSQINCAVVTLLLFGVPGLFRWAKTKIHGAEGVQPQRVPNAGLKD